MVSVHPPRPTTNKKKSKLLALKIEPFSLYNVDVSFRRFGKFGERLLFKGILVTEVRLVSAPGMLRAFRTRAER